MNEESAAELIKHYERDVIPLKDQKIAELQSALEAAREALTNIAEDNVHHPDNDGNCMLCNDEELSRCIQSAAKAALASLPAPQGKEEGK